MPLDDTHDPQLRSWVETANAPGSEFPIQNLPFGVFEPRGLPPRVGVRIGDAILDLHACLEAGLFTGSVADAAASCAAPALNDLMALGREAAGALRRQVSAWLREDPRGNPARSRVEPFLVPSPAAVMRLPAAIGDYTDFYASIYHATNVGSMFRPDEPLLPNYRHLPVGYHGRASSIVPSGTPVRRPSGQYRPQGSSEPAFGPSGRLDYELEVGMFVGRGNPLGTSIGVADAESHLFGVCLVNDWSARDIQQWEYQPLGPFLGKSFATTISPWVVTLDALEPFRAPAVREPSDPPLLPYLDPAGAARPTGLDLRLSVLLSTRAMRETGVPPQVLSQSSTRHLYWTFAQMTAHHTVNGCNLRPGDLVASGTVSGPTRASRGCLLELTWRGTEPLELPTGETRRFLEDGDEVTLTGWCERDGFARIGFGECRGEIVPALDSGDK